MSDWEAVVTDAGGFDTFRGSYPARQSPVGVGSIVTGYRTDGSVLYQGRVYAPPKVREGVGVVNAQGFALLADKYTQPLLYRVDGADRWVTEDSDPHGYSANDNMGIRNNQTQLVVTVQTGDTYAANVRVGWVLWLEGCDINRAGWRWNTPLGTMPNYDIRLYAANGPSGPLGTATVSHDMSTAGPGLDDANVPEHVDQIALQVVTNSAIASQSVRRKTVIDRLRVWGRLTADTITAPDVVSDLCQVLGYDDALVTSSAADVMPLLWENATASDLMNYLCDVMDWRWLVLEDRGSGPVMDFGPYSRDWTGSFGRGVIDDDLTELEVYSHVQVHFTSISDESRHVIVVADPNPLADMGYSNVYTVELNDPQPDDSLATFVAGQTMNWASTPRVRGRVTLYEVADGGGNFHSGYDVMAGDRLQVSELGPRIGPQRIASVTYSESRVEAELSEDIHLGRILRQAKQKRKRHHHH